MTNPALLRDSRTLPVLMATVIGMAATEADNKRKMSAEEYAAYKERQKAAAAAREKARAEEAARAQAEYDAAAAPYREARRARKAAQLAREQRS